MEGEASRTGTNHPEALLRYTMATHRRTRDVRLFRDRRHAGDVLGDLADWALVDRYDPAWRLPVALLPDTKGRPAGHPEHRPPRAARSQRRTHG